MQYLTVSRWKQRAKRQSEVSSTFDAIQDIKKALLPNSLSLPFPEPLEMTRDIRKRRLTFGWNIQQISQCLLNARARHSQCSLNTNASITYLKTRRCTNSTFPLYLFLQKPNKYKTNTWLVFSINKILARYLLYSLLPNMGKHLADDTHSLL